MKHHPQTIKIFETLSRGQFICSNSADDEQRRLFSTIEENYDDLFEYFQPIGYLLERGEEYFYFTRKEARADLEKKIEQAYRWIDILDFFKAFNSGFGVGFRFTPAEVLVQVKIDANLKDKLEQIKRSNSEGGFKGKVEQMIDDLCKYGFVEEEAAITQQYKVLSAYKYIENLLMNVHIEDLNNEVSQ